MAIEFRDGRWRVRLRLHGQPHLSKTFATEAAAREWQDRAADAVKLGRIGEVLAADITFRAVAEHYRDAKLIHKRGRLQEGRRLDQLLRLPLADLALQSISRRTLRELRDARLKIVRGSTWNRELSLLTQVLRFAVAEHDAGLDVRSLTAGLRGRESPGRQGRISPADEAQLLAHAEGWHGPMIRLALLTGCRRGELFGLTHADIDRQTMTLRIAGTKTAASDRVIPIGGSVLAAVDSLPRSIACERILWQACTPDALTGAWRRCAARAGLGHIVLHLARHEFLSRAADRGASVAQLKALGGHCTLAMLSRYVKASPESARHLIAA